MQLASAMEATPATTKPRLPLADLMSHGLNLNKVQQRFNVLSVALASEALTLTSLLLEDLSSEMVGDKNEGNATLDLFTVSLLFCFFNAASAKRSLLQLYMNKYLSWCSLEY